MIRILLLSILPITIPFLLTIGQMLTVGDIWPRIIAVGSGLKLWGLIASAFTAACVLWFVAKTVADKKLVRFTGLFCVITGLFGWPFWSVGLLPSINGVSLSPEQILSMRVERLETTRRSRQRTLNHWAWLTPQVPGPGPKAGRYFISEDIHTRWTQETPRLVEVTYARGALGALVVTGFRQRNRRSLLTPPF